MPRKKEKIEISGKEKNIVELLDELISQIKKDSEVYTAIKKKKQSTRGFGFETLVKDIYGEGDVERLKKARQRLKNIPDDESNNNYQALKILYDKAQEKYLGIEKIPIIQSISMSARKEARDNGIDWEQELKKFSDHLKFIKNK